MRDYTKGHPEIAANNHPIRHGAVVGIHNGIIENDDDVLARYGLERAERDMTVDSEAIFALMELRRHAPRALAELRGAMAAAWLDERDPATLFLARGRARPLWIGRTRTDLFFASTRRALAIVEAALRVPPGAEGSPRRTASPTSTRGRIVRERRFRPDRRYREEGYLPPVRAPHEAVSASSGWRSSRRRRPDQNGLTHPERVEQRARSRRAADRGHRVAARLAPPKRASSATHAAS